MDLTSLGSAAVAKVPFPSSEGQGVTEGCYLLSIYVRQHDHVPSQCDVQPVQFLALYVVPTHVVHNRLPVAILLKQEGAQRAHTLSPGMACYSALFDILEAK